MKMLKGFKIDFGLKYLYLAERFFLKLNINYNLWNYKWFTYCKTWQRKVPPTLNNICIWWNIFFHELWLNVKHKSIITTSLLSLVGISLKALQKGWFQFSCKSFFVNHLVSDQMYNHHFDSQPHLKLLAASCCP